MTTTVFTRDELLCLGISLRGHNISVDRSCRLFNPQNLSLGPNTRIDCFTVITAGREGVEIGANVHIAAGVMLFGGGGRIRIEDFCNLSGRVLLYTSSDDYVEGYMTNPTVPEDLRKVTSGSIHLCKHSIVGAGSVVLPGVTLGFGAAVGACSLVRNSVCEGDVVAGVPARSLRKTRDCSRLRNLELRCREMLQLPADESR